MEKAIRIGKLKKIDETSAKVLRHLSEKIGMSEEYVSYTDIAETLRLSRNAVKYAIERMHKDGRGEIRDRKISLGDAVVEINA